MKYIYIKYLHFLLSIIYQSMLAIITIVDIMNIYTFIYKVIFIFIFIFILILIHIFILT